METMIVDYRMSPQELFVSGSYCHSWGDEDVLAYFPVRHRKALTKVQFNPDLISISPYASEDDAREEMKRQRVRPAAIIELLVYGIKYPTAHIDCRIIGLGSCALVHNPEVGGVWHPYIHIDQKGRRTLGRMAGYMHGWERNSLFLGVRRVH